ncbi:MAG TPA: ATP-binding protein [Candidatus Aminicenantes bacterium]|nr:ATP-binding protein [Candidatus Aminicenantes bacterium]
MFVKATKKQAKLRAAVFGPAGAGKTFTALAIAKGLGGKVALIDSERSSAAKYADRYDFDTVDLGRKNIAEYIEYIGQAGEAGYDVLIIDSLSHAWAELLEEIDKLAGAKYKGNTWSAWSEGTPKQKKLVDAILSYPGHIIATMRSKTEWQTTQDGNGKSRPVRVGLAPEQGKGIEYEFDLLLELSTDHVANVIKDRTGKFQDQLIDKPGEKFGRELVAWLSEGAAPEPEKPAAKPEPTNGKKTDPVRNGKIKDIAEIVSLPIFSDGERKLYRTEIPNTTTEKLDDILSEVRKIKASRENVSAEEEAGLDALFAGEGAQK